MVTRLRCGSHSLQVEAGRWTHTPREERLCKICVTGAIEDEWHFICECYAYDRLRAKLFSEIMSRTGYDLNLMADSKEWIADALIGHGLLRLEVRKELILLAGRFLLEAMAVRNQTL